MISAGTSVEFSNDIQGASLFFKKMFDLHICITFQSLVFLEEQGRALDDLEKWIIIESST